MIQNHDCTKGFSTNFIGIDDSFNFVPKWEEVAQTGNDDDSTLNEDSKSTTTRTTGASVVSSGVVGYDKPSPSKRRRFMTDVLDEGIERAKKG